MTGGDRLRVTGLMGLYFVLRDTGMKVRTNKDVKYKSVPMTLRATLVQDLQTTDKVVGDKASTSLTVVQD